MKIYGTGKYAEMPKGKEYNEPEDMARLLVEKGAATYEQEAPEKKAEVAHTPKKKK